MPPGFFFKIHLAFFFCLCSSLSNICRTVATSFLIILSTALAFFFPNINNFFASASPFLRLSPCLFNCLANSLAFFSAKLTKPILTKAPFFNSSFLSIFATSSDIVHLIAYLNFVHWHKRPTSQPDCQNQSQQKAKKREDRNPYDLRLLQHQHGNCSCDNQGGGDQAKNHIA